MTPERVNQYADACAMAYVIEDVRSASHRDGDTVALELAEWWMNRARRRMVTIITCEARP